MRAMRVHPAHWPLAARAALLLTAALACGASGLLLYLRPCATARDAAQAHLQAQQARLLPALARAATLPALRARHGQLVMRATAQAQQLWPPQDLPRLRDKLNRRASECGLVLESFRPLAGSAGGDASAAVTASLGPGAELSLSGNYGAMRCFVTRSSRAPWPVLFDGLDIAPRATSTTSATPDGGPPALLLQASVHVTPAPTPGETP